MNEQSSNSSGQPSNAPRAAAILLAMIVVISALIWAGVHNARARRIAMQEANDKAASMATLTRTTGDGSDASGYGPTLKLQGKPAPAFALVDLDGRKVSLADFKGKPVLVNFWATWCGPCKIEMPWFQEFQQKYAGQGLIILGVAADDASKTLITTTARKLGVTYPILLKDEHVETAYGGVEYLPESFYVGPNGKVLIETAGLTSETGGKDEIEANIKKLLAAGGQ